MNIIENTDTQRGPETILRQGFGMAGKFRMTKYVV